MQRAVDILADKQKSTEHVRNICVLAHVDHGKTTLTDCLISHNGFINQKQAGSLRMMDFLEEEQRRGITMKSASIALQYTSQPSSSSSSSSPQSTLINVIDSPGHVDFCSEVSTAARLSDGALVLVDVCEGVCVQTHAVLRQAWEEKLKPCLIFNKMDRLIEELKYSPLETYERLRMLLHEVNSLMSAFESEKFINQADTFLSAEDKRNNSNSSDDSNEIVEDLAEYLDDQLDMTDAEDVFSIERGNVAFASAMDGWAFRPEQFARLYAEKLGCSEKALKKGLWGDWFYHPKSKRIVGKKLNPNGKLKPLFVQCILDPIWKLYDAADEYYTGDRDLPTLAKSLKLMNISEKDLMQSNKRMTLLAIMRNWLPLSSAILEMVVHSLPNPVEAMPFRIERLLSPSDSKMAAYDDILKCKKSSDATTVVFISKMVAVPLSSIHGGVREGSETHGDSKFVGFGRVFAGIVRKGDKMYVLGGAEPTEIIVSELYLMMGQGMFPVDEVPSGNLLAIGGLDKVVLKSSTLSSSLECPLFGSMMFQASAIVKVAVEPENVQDMPLLLEGLRLLNRADAFVEMEVMDSGEHVLSAAGEVHLERCINDLRERFARVPIRVSKPLVNFKEGITTSGFSDYKIGSKKVLRASVERLIVVGDEEDEEKEVEEQDGEGTTTVNKTEKKNNNNALIIKRSGSNSSSSSGGDGDTFLDAFEESIRLGFQLACERGPICDEPLDNVKVTVEFLDAPIEDDDEADNNNDDQLNSGQVITFTRDVIRQAVMQSNPRLIEAMYLAVITTTSEALNGTYAVLGRRRSDIISESIREGTGVFIIHAYLPVATSFGFADELRKLTSGASSAQLVFSHWKELDIDPYQKLGEDGEELTDNVARDLMDMVRKRKGLKVDEKVVKVATKQRTLSRKT
jgi:ribosome assembly protein 1